MAASFPTVGQPGGGRRHGVALIGGAGYADAATGGTFILGKASKETSTAAVTVTAGDTLLERCIANGNNGSFADDAGIIAIRVLATSHH